MILYRKKTGLVNLVLKEKCTICRGHIEKKYMPMKEWKINGPLCNKCYSKKIGEHYPGEHVRVNLGDGD